MIDDPEAFGHANARFHERLVELSGNQTIGIVAEMLNEIIARAVTAVSQATVEAQLARRPASAASARRSG